MKTRRKIKKVCCGQEDYILTQLRGMCQSEEMGGITQAGVNRNRKCYNYIKDFPNDGGFLLCLLVLSLRGQTC